MIEVVGIDMVKIQGIWNRKYENLKSAIAVWGIVPKGMSKFKKRIQKDDVADVTMSGKILQAILFGEKSP